MTIINNKNFFFIDSLFYNFTYTSISQVTCKKIPPIVSDFLLSLI